MLELFQLFNWCQPMGVTVEDLTAEATRLGLSKSQLQMRQRAAYEQPGSTEETRKLTLFSMSGQALPGEPSP